jgi:MATE family multidrug resistance protein
MLSGVVEAAMLARVDVQSLAASALGNLWQWSIMSLGVGAVMGTDPLISQAHGRGDGAAAALALQRGLVIALLASLPLCAAMALTGPALRSLGEPTDVAELAQQFNLLKLSTVPCFLAFTALRQYLQSRGLLAPATWVAFLSTLANGLLGYALIFGRLGSPVLGLRGAAIADAASSLLLALAAWVLVRSVKYDGGALRRWDVESFSWPGLRQTLRLGLPIGAQMALEACAFSLASFMCGWISVRAIGGHQIALNMAALSFMVPFGLSMGAATRVGNLIGEADELGMRRAVRTALVFGAGVMVFAASAFTLLRHQLPRLYTDDKELLLLAAQLLPVAGAFQIFDGTQAVAGGVLRGMGRPQIAALVNLLGYYALTLPLAYALGFRASLGVVGIWIALALGLMVVASALLFFVRRTLRIPIAELQLRVSHGGSDLAVGPAL